MELKRITLPPRTAPGEVTTFYSFESGTARSVALSNMAVLLAGRQNATVPVLMIDFDTESPGLHHYFDRTDERPGVLEYFQACYDHLLMLGRGPAAADDVGLARQVLEAIDWELYVERVDNSRPLYLMRAGRFDDSYGERADQMDWDGLFTACPALFRCFADYMGQRFRHVLVDARSGRSAAVSICTTLLPRKLVTLFTPNQRSLDGLAGVVTRAIDYRCSHEDEQRPLLVYPLASSIDSADCQRRVQWRRGDPNKAVAGYQPLLERLLRQCYGMSHCSLDSYLDEVQLQQTNAMSSGEHLSSCLERDADRFSLTRTFDTLLDWLVGNHFPWQSLAEVRLAAAIAGARAMVGEQLSTSISLPLARDLYQLGELYLTQGRREQALECFQESAQLRERLLGDEHADTRASLGRVALLLRDAGKLAEARALQEQLLAASTRLHGGGHPDTLAARAALAATLAMMGEFERALALHEELIDSCERLLGPSHAVTFDSLAGQAQTLARRGELTRARMVYERVLEGRERLLGSEHEDTLRCTQQLAMLLLDMGDMHNARKLQESVVSARERHAGPDHAATMQARELLAEIMASQGDLAGVRGLFEILARARERSLGAEHPDTLSSQLKLASMLSDQGELDAARRLQQKLVELHEKVHGADAVQTLNSKKALAAILSRQGHSVDARKLEDAVQQGSARLIGKHGMLAGPHLSDPGAPVQRGTLFDTADGGGQAETLSHKLTQLQELIDNRSEREARELADSLRKSVLRFRSVAHPLRSRGVAMIKQVYLRDNDKDALLAFAQDEVSSLHEALIEAGVAKV